MSYIVVETTSLTQLTSKCSEAISAGYIPAGGVSVDPGNGMLRQALYRPAGLAPQVDQWQGR